VGSSPTVFTTETRSGPSFGAAPQV
jgi:hypothetical protein